ncbi:MAG: hypothetical protein QXI02_04055 [Candidatus Caldarchaeum sp.]
MAYTLTLNKVINKQIVSGKADDRRFTIAIDGIPDTIPQPVAWGAVETALLKTGGNLGQERFWNPKTLQPGATVKINWNDIVQVLTDGLSGEADNALMLYQASKAVINGTASPDQADKVRNAEIPQVSANNVQRVLALIKAKALLGAIDPDRIAQIRAEILNLIS